MCSPSSHKLCNIHDNIICIVFVFFVDPGVLGAVVLAYTDIDSITIQFSSLACVVVGAACSISLYPQIHKGSLNHIRKFIEVFLCGGGGVGEQRRMPGCRGSAY